MVFGLVCGLLIFITAVAFMNVMYQTVIQGALGSPQSIGYHHLVVSRLIFSMIYVILVYIAANNSFKLIHAFPDNALLWIGQNPHRRESFGEAEDLVRLGPVVSGYAGQQVFGKAQEAGKTLQQGAQNAGARSGQNVATRQNAETAATHRAEDTARADETNALLRHPPGRPPP